MEISNREKILSILNSELSYTQISDNSGIDKKNLAYYLRILIKENKIEKVSEGRDARYKIIQQTEIIEPTLEAEPKEELRLEDKLLKIVEQEGSISRAELVRLHNFRNRHITRIASKAIANGKMKKLRRNGRVIYYWITHEFNESDKVKNLSEVEIKMQQIPVLQRFINHMTHSHHASETTTYNYKLRILDFMGFKSKAHGFNPISLDKITLQYLDDFNDYMSQTKKYSIASQVSRLASIKSFFKFCLERKFMTLDLTKYIHYPRIPEQKQIDLDIAEYDLMLNNASCYRDYVMMEFMLFSGMRVGEVSSANLSNINFEKGEVCDIFIEGIEQKGKRNRLTHLPREIYADLKKYIDAERKPFNGEPALFTTRSGTRMQKRTIEFMIKQTRRRAGIAKQITCHSFRRACARMLYERGFDIREIQEILGHKNINTTMKYINVQEKFVKERYDSSSTKLIADISAFRTNAVKENTMENEINAMH